MTGILDVDPREERLPKWARERLARTRRALVDAQVAAEAARLRTNPHGTDTLLYPYADVPIGLPKGERVRYLIGRDPDRWVDVRACGGHVEVMASTGVHVRPSASNVVEIGLAR